MASEPIECPDCGAAITGEEHVHVEQAPEMAVEDGPEPDTRTFKLGAARHDVYRCKGCGAILGVR